MRRSLYFLLTILLTSNVLSSDEQEEAKSFTPFTGKVTREKVRMRLEPALESPVVRTLQSDELLLVTGEEEEFFAVQPPKDVKAYVFRTFILDNVVEGNRVNVRIRPSLDAPVIAQLNTGERVDGKICAENNKWLEITPPKTVQFYVANDYLKNVGDPYYVQTMEKRKSEVNALLHSTEAIGMTELQKPFPQIELDGVYKNYEKIIDQFKDFPEKVTVAKKLLNKTHEAYLQRKLQYLEARAQYQAEQLEERESIIAERKELQEQFQELEEQIAVSDHPTDFTPKSYDDWAWETHPKSAQEFAQWVPLEKEFFEKWINGNEGASFEEFYETQMEDAVTLSGILEPYSRPVNNKPGDYMLLNRVTKQPIAYLYSTRVNLHNNVGQEITIHGALRPNHNFAFPAYYVLSME